MEDHPNFEFLGEIGRGETATVHRARDLALKRNVAVKVLHEQFRNDPQQLQRFWEEAQFLASLEHENIVKVHGVEKDRGWILMELMQGSLDARLAQGPLPADLVRSVLRQVLGGLEFLHQRQRLHGAVKPANLLINKQGQVKLSDTAGLAADGEIRKPTGTQKYLAPELLNPEFGPVGPGVDLYGLGFTALELLKGPDFASIFRGVGPDAVDPEIGWLRLHGSRSEPMPKTRDVVPNAPADLARVIDRLLERDVRP
jgi:eukaryotic-like serine/threonine-protein kinase